MRIAVLSGKGGTGKTLVSVNLAAAAEEAVYIDCDAEEPNGRLFFKPADIIEEPVTVMIPQVNNNLCIGCRKCVELCRFNALAYIMDRLLIFKEICHSCGGCVLVCPENALTESERAIGKIQRGISDSVEVSTGILNTGEASGVPIIKRLISMGSCEKNDPVHVDRPVFIDCPPGSACSVMESIKDADYCILVAEPTLFGAHNLNMVYELVKLFGKKYGVVLNKCLNGENPSEKLCIEKNIKILTHIPFDNELGILNSNGEIAVKKSEKYRDIFICLLEKVTKEVQNEGGEGA